jgi:hypothetical protein
MRANPSRRMCDHRSAGGLLPRLAVVFVAAMMLPDSLQRAMSAEPSPRPPGLGDAAQSALKKFLPALDSGAMKKTHGFAAEDDFKELSLGEPFEPFYLNPDGIGKYAGGKVMDSLVPSATWSFPVFSRGHLACLVSVVKWTDGKLLEEKLGMPELARAWAAITEAWPAGKGYTPIFIVVPSHQRFFFTVPQVEPPNMTPVSIERKESALPKTYEKLVPAPESFALLRS